MNDCWQPGSSRSSWSRQTVRCPVSKKKPANGKQLIFRYLFLLVASCCISLTMSNQINGGRGRTNALSSVDFYRRVPKDLTEVRNREIISPSRGSLRRLLRIVLPTAICLTHNSCFRPLHWELSCRFVPWGSWAFSFSPRQPHLLEPP